MSLQYLSDQISKHMHKWETEHADHTLEDWYWERERFTENIAINLWHDCQSDMLRLKAITEAN